MTLHRAFEKAAAARADHTALICGEDAVTYAALRDEAARLATGLRERGVAPGDRVVLCLPSRRELVCGILATLMAGAVFVVVHADVKDARLAHTLNDSGARVLVTTAARRAVDGPHTATILVDADTELASGEHTYADSLGGDPVPSTDPDPEALAMLVYTSGSTGSGKGVMMTHAAATFAADTISDYLGLTRDDVVLNFTPLSADYGLYNVLMTLRRGGTVVLQDGYLFPTQILDTAARHRVTGLALVPTIVAMFLTTKDLPAAALSTVRFVSSTGQALPTAHIRRLQELMPQCAIYSMYGLTECKRVSFLDPRELAGRPDSVGKAMAGTEVFLVDDSLTRVPAPAAGARARGELAIRGPHLMRGYWNQPEATAACLRPDPERPGELLLLSGDEFEIDDEGFLYFRARKDDLIKSSGERISPREIEDVLYRLPGVTGVVVTGVPDPIKGAAIHATVAVDQDANHTEATIRAHCADHLERAWLPATIELTDAIPRTLTGKLRRKAP